MEDTAPVDKDAQTAETCLCCWEEAALPVTWTQNNTPSSPCSATCRRPIKGAADRPVKSRELWKESLLFSPNTTKTASAVENRLTNRLASMPRSTALNSSSSPRPVFAAPPAGQTKAVSRSTFPWMKLLLLALLAALFFFVYQTMEPNSISPFDVAEVGGASDGKA